MVPAAAPTRPTIQSKWRATRPNNHELHHAVALVTPVMGHVTHMNMSHIWTLSSWRATRQNDSALRCAEAPVTLVMRVLAHI